MSEPGPAGSGERARAERLHSARGICLGVAIAVPIWLAIGAGAAYFLLQ